jgi:putative ubiquitin-RnfH superfamily antitoxin RatB of RatAB toxin-antitoxin module
VNEIHRKRCVVAYAAAEIQHLWHVELREDATVGDAIEAARELCWLRDIPWDTAPVGIFGELCERTDKPADQDRIELYRPLRSDPRARRRERVQRSRKQASR